MRLVMFGAVAAVMLAVGCGPRREKVEVYGHDGVDGTDGDNGKSGPAGKQGPQGEPGATGAQGPQGERGADGAPGVAGQSCSASEVEGGLMISCGDGESNSFYIRDGVDGRDGQNGADGADGRDGTDGADGADGQDGSDGEDGADGADGEDGSNGISSITSFTSSSCANVTATSKYYKVSGSNVGLYTSSTCHSSTKFAEVAQGEAYWITNSILAVWKSGGMNVIYFNVGE